MTKRAGTLYVKLCDVSQEDDASPLVLEENKTVEECLSPTLRLTLSNIRKMLGGRLFALLMNEDDILMMTPPLTADDLAKLPVAIDYESESELLFIPSAAFSDSLRKNPQDPA